MLGTYLRPLTNSHIVDSSHPELVRLRWLQNHSLLEHARIHLDETTFFRQVQERVVLDAAFDFHFGCVCERNVHPVIFTFSGGCGCS